MLNFLGQALFLITNVKNKLITYVKKHLILIKKNTLKGMLNATNEEH